MKKQSIICLSLATMILGSCSQKKEDKNEEIISVNTSYMDTTISPTDDFFMYANGTWSKNTPVPDDESRWGSFDELDKAIKEKLKTLVDATQSQKEHKKGSVEQLVGDFYYSFLDSTSRNKVGYEPIKPWLEKIDALNSIEELSTLLADLKLNGLGGIFGYYIYLDKKNSQLNTAYLSQGGLGLPNKDYYNVDKKDIQGKYRDHISKMFQLIDVDQKEANTIAEKIYALENKLAESSMTPIERRNPITTYNPTSLSDLQTSCPVIDWNSYFSNLGQEKIDSIIVTQIDFFNDLTKTIESTDIETIKNYLKWNILNQTASYLSTDFEKQNFQFYGTDLKGIESMKPASERAIEEMTGNAISEALGKLFVDEHFSKESKKRVNEMLDNIKEAFKDRLDGLTWMSPETKEKALIKLNSFDRKLGFPDEWKDLSSIMIDRNLYYDNALACTKFSVKENLEKYGKPVDEKEWGMPPHMVNAYYSPLRNEIVFPAAIMQYPFFDPKAEDAVNYGGIGMVIGHEFTHGFDDQGAQYAPDGNLSNWWTTADSTEFSNRTAKLKENYNEFCPFDSICVQGGLTLGENIADLGGLTLAYYAYMKTDEAKSGKKVNGFTPAQRLFIAYAQLWKINYKEDALKNLLATDPHSPGMYRVNGPLMNMPEFFEAFDVQEGDPMRRDSSKIAKIW